MEFKKPYTSISVDRETLRMIRSICEITGETANDFVSRITMKELSGLSAKQVAKETEKKVMEVKKEYEVK
jgi:negative regulator of replication initiation